MLQRRVGLCAEPVSAFCSACEEHIETPCHLFTERWDGVTRVSGCQRWSEADLHMLRSRPRGGVLAQARRGRTRLTARLQFPLRIRTGPNKCDLTWIPLQHHLVLQVLPNQRHADAFCFGRHKYPPLADGRFRLEQPPHDGWLAPIPDAHDCYITLAEFEVNESVVQPSATRGLDQLASDLLGDLQGTARGRMHSISKALGPFSAAPGVAQIDAERQIAKRALLP